jgi:hypothetical protein
MIQKNNMKKGQVVLFVIVVLTVVIIIISSLVERSLTGQKNTSINTDSSRAFNAAEAGIDELLSRSDLAAIAIQNNSETYQTKAIDRTFFSDAHYSATSTNPGYFGTISQNSLLQINFDPSFASSLNVFMDSTACSVMSLYSYANASPSTFYVNRYFVCGATSGFPINGYLPTETCSSQSAFLTTDCTKILVPAGQIAKMLTISVLVDSSKVDVQPENGDYSSFLTKAVTGDAFAKTNSGVQKEIQVNTKTTKDIYPVFDHVLYIR